MAAADFILGPLTCCSCTESIKLLWLQLNLGNLGETECRIGSSNLLKGFFLILNCFIFPFTVCTFQLYLDLICQNVFWLFIIQWYLLFNFLKQTRILKTFYSCPSLLILPICIYGGCRYVCTCVYIYIYAYSHCSPSECLSGIDRPWKKKSHFITSENNLIQELSQGPFDWYCCIVTVYIFVHVVKQ